MKHTRRVVLFGSSIRSAGHRRLGAYSSHARQALNAHGDLDAGRAQSLEVTVIASKELRVLKTQFARLVPPRRLLLSGWGRAATNRHHSPSVTPMSPLITVLCAYGNHGRRLYMIATEPAPGREQRGAHGGEPREVALTDKQVEVCTRYQVT